MARETNNDLAYITSCKRPRFDTAPSFDLPPLPFQSTVNTLDTHGQLRYLQSQTASTSAAPVEDGHLFSYLDHSGMEFDAGMHYLQEISRRQSRSLLLAIKQRAIRQLIKKESELQNAKQRNAQLEEKLLQIYAEICVWFDAAKNNETLAAALRTKLDQAFKAVTGGSDGCDANEAEDAQSCCFEGSKDGADMASRPRKFCRGCGGKNACVVLLPCRHLCLCKECEAVTAMCPVCFSVKNASMEISVC